MITIMPLAGRGSSFLAQDIKIPKPLVMVKGKPMVKWATGSVPFVESGKLIFVVRKDHVKDHAIDKELRKLYKGCDVEIVSTNGLTEGALCTVLLARDLIDSEDELIIYNPDQYFSSNLERDIKEKDEDVKGIIPVFYATHLKWSFAKADSKGNILQVAEKEPISTNATAGLYYFTQGKDFIWAADKMVKDNKRVGGQFYVCPVYNELIERGDKIIVSTVDSMWGLGTPEEVARFEKYYKG